MNRGKVLGQFRVAYATWNCPSRFMVPMHAKKRKRALHEPAWQSDRSLSLESGAEDARTPDASRLRDASEAREASGLRPIYRRFHSGVVLAGIALQGHN